MPNRWIREGILSSQRVEELDYPAEVFYRRLLSKVDDHGLYDARPSVLRASLYPLRLDRVREADISRWLVACEAAGLTVLYEAAGKPYLKVLDTRWQARSDPKFPGPPSPSCKQLRATANNCAPKTLTLTKSKSGTGTTKSVLRAADSGPPAKRSKRQEPDNRAWQGMIDHIHRSVLDRKTVAPEWTGQVMARLKAKTKRFEPEGVMALWDEACRRLWYADRAGQADSWNARRWTQYGHSVLFFLDVLCEWLCEDNAWKDVREKYRAKAAGLRWCGKCKGWTVKVTPDRKSLACQQCGQNRPVRPEDKITKEADHADKRDDTPGGDVGGVGRAPSGG